MARGPGFLEAQLEAMSKRDRALLTGLIVVGAIGFIVVLSYGLSSMLEDRASRVRDAKESLETVLLFRNDYLDAMDTIRASEDHIRQYKGQRLSAFLEKVAQENGVTEKLEKVEKGETETVGTFTQTSYAVTFRKLPMDTAIHVLYDVEGTGFPLKVDDAQFIVTYDKREKMLDLMLDIVVYELAEGA